MYSSFGLPMCIYISARGHQGLYQHPVQHGQGSQNRLPRLHVYMHGLMWENLFIRERLNKPNRPNSSWIQLNPQLSPYRWKPKIHFLLKMPAQSSASQAVPSSRGQKESWKPQSDANGWETVFFCIRKSDATSKYTCSIRIDNSIYIIEDAGAMTYLFSGQVHLEATW